MLNIPWKNTDTYPYRYFHNLLYKWFGSDIYMNRCKSDDIHRHTAYSNCSLHNQ